MNVRVGTNGDIFTAESEGLIKRYSAKGEFLGLVANAPLTGGCKNVAVAVTGFLGEGQGEDEQHREDRGEGQ